MNDINPEDYAVTGWGKKALKERDLTLPSGQKCRIRKLEMEDILELDIMDIMDTFTSQLMANPEDKVKEADSALATLELLKDKGRREKFIDAVNRVVPVAVVLPQVLPDPEPGRPKREGAVYVSDVDLTDKTEIFGAAFSGWGDVTGFRTETQENLGVVAKV